MWSSNNESAVVQTAAMECSSAEQQQWDGVVWSSNDEAEVMQHGSNEAAVGCSSSDEAAVVCAAATRLQ